MPECLRLLYRRLLSPGAAGAPEGQWCGAVFHPGSIAHPRGYPTALSDVPPDADDRAAWPAALWWAVGLERAVPDLMWSTEELYRCVGACRVVSARSVAPMQRR